MRYNKVSPVVEDVIRYPKHQIKLNEQTDEIENGINVRFEKQRHIENKAKI